MIISPVNQNLSVFSYADNKVVKKDFLHQAADIGRMPISLLCGHWVPIDDEGRVNIRLKKVATAVSYSALMAIGLLSSFYALKVTLILIALSFITGIVLTKLSSSRNDVCFLAYSKDGSSRFDLNFFAKYFEKSPTLKFFGQAHCFAARLSNFIQDLKDENERMSANYIQVTCLKKIRVTFLRIFGFNPLLTNRLNINSLEQILRDLEVGLKKLSPDKWSLELLPKALPAYSWNNELKIQNKSLLSSDLTRTKCYIWNERTWELLPKDYEGLAGLLKQKGSIDAMAEAKALSAATQDTFSTVVVKLDALGLALHDVGYKVYFAVEEGKVRMYSQARAKIIPLSLAKLGHTNHEKFCSLYALYNPQEDDSHVQVRLI